MKRFRRLTVSIAAVALCATTMLAPIGSLIPKLFPETGITQITASAAFNYTNSDMYAADCLQKGIISLEDGTPSSLGPVIYKMSMDHEFTYDRLARAVMEDKSLITLSGIWSGWNTVASGDFKSLSETEVYEALIMDYLTYEEKSEEYQSELDLKLAKQEWAIYNKLIDLAMDSNKELTKDAAAQVVKKSSFLGKSDNEEAKKLLEAYKKDGDALEKLKQYTGIINDLEEVGSNAKDYYETLAKALAVQEADKNRIEFLQHMKTAAKGNTAFCAAVDNIMLKYQASYPYLSALLGSKKMAEYSLGKAWDELTKEVPCFAAFKLGVTGMDIMFNSNATAANNYKIMLIYTMEQFAKQAVYNSGSNYATVHTQANAKVYLSSYLSYLKYQQYATNWGRTFVSDILYEGAWNSICNVFSDKNKHTYEEYMDLYDYDDSKCRQWADFIRKWQTLYNNYMKVENLSNNDAKVIDNTVTIDSVKESTLQSVDKDGTLILANAIKLDKDLTLDCNTELTGTLDLNGCTLTINGNLLQKSGSITCNNGTLNVLGNYSMENGVENNVGEIEYNSCNAYLYMTNQHDKVNISGDFTTHNLLDSRSVRLDYGTFSVAGDIWSDKGISASTSYGSKVVLNGTSDQNVFTYGTYFNILEVTNPDSRDVNYSGIIKFSKLGSDINIVTDSLSLGSLDLNRNTMTIKGNANIIQNETINLDGGTLTINGNLLQKSGSITCNNGTLNVLGNYSMENGVENNVGEIEYNSCNAYLYMTNQHDKVNISGDFTTHNLLDSRSVRLDYGTFSVAGDIWSDKGIFASTSYGSKVVLNGSQNQSVSLASSNKFNILVITKPKSNYSFNPENCWVKLKTVEAGSGDADGDGETTVKDVIALQKWLLGKRNSSLSCWQSVDLNEDGIFDIYDLALLKRKLLKK